jgi:putative nucleotidyltransferase with HDIG domain
MAKQDGKARLAKSKAPPVDLARRARNREITALGLFASLVLSALLTQDLFPAGFGAGLAGPGDIADRSYKAPAAVRIVDEEATEELRHKAVERAPLLYDFDERRPAAVRERVTAAFAAARQALAAEPTEEGAKVAPVAAFRAALGEQVEVPELSLQYLGETGFDFPAENRLKRLVSAVVGRMIVDDAPEFERQVEKRSVVVRELGSGNERRLGVDHSVLSLASSSDQLRQEAERIFDPESEAERRALLALAEGLVRPNLSFNLRATDERRKAAGEGVKEVVISLRKGEIIVRDGDLITDRHVLILNGIYAEERTSSRLKRFLGVAILVFVLLTLIWRFGSSGVQRFPQQTKDVRFLLLTLLLSAMGTGVGIFLCDAVAESPTVAPLIEQTPGRLYFIIPIAAAVMLVRLVQSAETAALFAVLIALLAGLQVRGEVGFACYALAGSLTAARAAARVTQRGTLLRAGVRVGVVNVLVIGALDLLGGQLNVVPVLVSLGLGFAAGLVSGMLVTALAPAVESLFSYTTDVKLLELENREQVLLRELEFRAPGTYHHSMMVGHLAEKAAAAIGANALLAKVAGYYHDIGKMRRPHFFVENVTIHRGENRHEKLSPSMSARIIQAHVKDGLEYGDQFKLAPPIMRGIAQHHGTSVIRFFFEKAKDVADPEKGELVEEHDYRYPGPRPQTREAGILMLADSVEAASRTLADTSRARVQQLVQRIINNYFRDGQLDECSLTLRDLHAIARSFIDTLSAIRHERIDYPEATDPEGRKLEEDTDEGVVERLEPGQKDRPERSAEERKGGLKRLGLP